MRMLTSADEFTTQEWRVSQGVGQAAREPSDTWILPGSYLDLLSMV